MKIHSICLRKRLKQKNRSVCGTLKIYIQVLKKKEDKDAECKNASNAQTDVLFKFQACHTMFRFFCASRLRKYVE